MDDRTPPGVYDYYDLLAEAARVHPSSVAVLADTDRYTYAQLHGRAEEFAAALYGLGLRSGDRVALCMGNEIEWIVAFFALTRLRAPVVLVSTAWMGHEIKHALAVTVPVGIIADAAKADLIDEAGRPTYAVLHGSADERPGWQRWADLPPGPRLPVTVGPGDPSDLELVLPFSSGTTGMPKAVRHSHRSLCLASEQWRIALGMGRTDRLQVITPLSHILGVVNIGATTSCGATARLFRRFDVHAMLQSIQDDGITIGLTVAPIAAALAGLPDLEGYRLDTLRYLNWSATPVNEDVARRVSARTGIGWLPAYGATEVPIIAVSPVESLPHGRLDSVGLAGLGVEIEALSMITGEFLPRGETGELAVRSPAAMLGYLPAESPSPFAHGDWYRTGDIGCVESDGWVHVTDRAKELIKVSGYQVSPVEIEMVLSMSPLVADCAVFAVPDERRGEMPCAAVVPVDAYSADANYLLEWLTPQLAPYKRLRAIFFVEAIPRTPSGKIQRRRLTSLVEDGGLRGDLLSGG